MATIIQRPGKNGQTSYRAQVRRKGAPPLSATFTKLSDARKWVQVTEAAIVEGRHFKTAEAKRHTLADLIDRYCTDVLPQKAQETVYGQTLQFRWWKAQLGHYALADVTPALLVECRDQLARDHKNATVTRYLGTLSHAFSVAVREWGWLDDSPMRKVTKPRLPRGRVRYLSDLERQRLLTECQASRNPHLYIVVMLALSCGARKTELVSLRWSDVDLKRCTLTFHETKNGERRTVPLTGQALNLMRHHAKVRRLDTLFVFPNDQGKRYFRFRETFENAVKRAGIADFHFHDLRHTAASYLAMNGASLHEIAEVLGHKTLAMVKRYAHLSEGHTRSVVERMNRAVFGEV
jgi:integrase